jgi:hypothetical protein
MFEVYLKEPDGVYPEEPDRVFLLGSFRYTE